MGGWTAQRRVEAGEWRWRRRPRCSLCPYSAGSGICMQREGREGPAAGEGGMERDGEGAMHS